MAAVGSKSNMYVEVRNARNHTSGHTVSVGSFIPNCPWSESRIGTKNCMQSSISTVPVPAVFIKCIGPREPLRVIEWIADLRSVLLAQRTSTRDHPPCPVHVEHMAPLQ